MVDQALVWQVGVDRPGTTAGDAQTGHPPGDGSAQLRGQVARNMRLLKAGLAMMTGAGIPRHTLDLIDDTLIAALSDAAEAVVPIDPVALFRAAADVLPNGADALVIGPLPRLLTCPGRMRLLVRELVLGVLRRMPPPDRVEVGAAGHPDGDPVIWIRSGRARGDGWDRLPSASAGCVPEWSLARRLAAQMGADLLLPGDGRGGAWAALRLPRDMLATGH